MVDQTQKIVILPKMPAEQHSRSESVADEILKGLEALRVSVDNSVQQIARLATAIEAALGALEERGQSHLGAGTSGAPGRKTVNWVIGPADNIGWAYGNNAVRLSQQLANYKHRIADTRSSDVAIYFDALVAERYKIQSKRSILRIGGPRPLDRLYGDDVAAMRRAFKTFDAIVALNAALYFRALRAHDNVHLVPNAIDLRAWHPRRRKGEDRPFTLGFAASLTSSAEAETKGYAIAKGAAERLGAPLLLTSKGGNQIPHDRMIEDFYSKIDVLVQPAGPGREGTSNVIMEALALGVPVVTTVHCGFHGEFLVDGEDALVRERDELAFTESIAALQRDERLRRKLGAKGREFAVRHHDLAKAANAYGEIIANVIQPKPEPMQPRPKVAFVPFWQPMENFGSSRLRAKYPSEYVAASGRFQATVGYSEDADIVVIVQMCDDETLAKIRQNTNQFVIYDVCDKYYENPRLFKHIDPPVESISRFQELSDRADLIIVPTRELKAEIASRREDKPVKFIPEPADYGASGYAVRPAENKTALWFGNPDRGNFESARWMIERLRDRHGFRPLLVSRKSFFKAHPGFFDVCRDWSVPAMEQAFAEASLCVVAYDDAEQAKSPNRFISAMMQGVPTLACNSPACAELLEETGHAFAIISGELELDRAVRKLQSAEFRELYVRRVQRTLKARYGDKATAETYGDLFQNYAYQRAVFSSRPRRVAFVSHNLVLGEGAPRSLFELATGIRGSAVSPFAYSTVDGPMAAAYAQAGVPLQIFDRNGRNPVKLLNARIDAIRTAFTAYLKENEIEAVVCNTVKSAPFVEFAHENGIPAAVIVRESYGVEERFVHFRGDTRLSAMLGLATAEHIIFVAESSREMWADQPFLGAVQVVPNGISLDRFAEGAGKTQAQAREELGFAPNDVVALCVGTINARKGQAELMQAFAELPAEIRQKASIVFLGAVENSHLSNFTHTYHALPSVTRDRIRVVRVTDDVAPYYRACDFFLMNSSSEAYPRSVVEALMFGLPVLSTRVFGVREQVKDQVSGFLYDANDMASWKGHFAALATRAELRARMSAKAIQGYWKLTGYEEMLLAYRSVIARMVKGPG